MSTPLHPGLRAEAEAIATEAGCQLFDLVFDAGVLRVILDRVDGAVTLDDCTTVSRQLSAFLDVNDFGSKKYTLEVSSPGLDRPLRGAEDFRRFLGQLAHVTYTPQDESKPATEANGARHGAVSVIGRLETFDESTDGGAVVLIEPLSEARHVIPVARVQRARLEIDI